MPRFKVMQVGIHNLAYECFRRGLKLDEKEEKREIGMAVTKTSNPPQQSGTESISCPRPAQKKFFNTGTGTCF